MVRFFKKSYGGLASSVMYGSSIEALKELVDSGAGTQVVKITPRGYKLPNGVHYCSVEVKTLSGEYLLQAYGNEATELYEKASFVLEGTMICTVIILTFFKMWPSLSSLIAFGGFAP